MGSLQIPDCRRERRRHRSLVRTLQRNGLQHCFRWRACDRTRRRVHAQSRRRHTHPRTRVSDRHEWPHVHPVHGPGQRDGDEHSVWELDGRHHDHRQRLGRRKHHRNRSPGLSGPPEPAHHPHVLQHEPELLARIERLLHQPRAGDAVGDTPARPVDTHGKRVGARDLWKCFDADGRYTLQCRCLRHRRLSQPDIGDANGRPHILGCECIGDAGKWRSHVRCTDLLGHPEDRGHGNVHIDGSGVIVTADDAHHRLGHGQRGCGNEAAGTASG